MGDVNQLIFVERHAADLAGPYLEVGSKDYGSTQDLRALLAGRERYVGADQEAGANVDVVVDFTADFAQIDAVLGGARFGTIFCLSVLEHCPQPFLMAENLTRLLAPGGRVCLSVPFAWCFHAYPSDYWRFTHEGVKLLFPRLEFDPAEETAASSRPGDFTPLERDVGRIYFGTKGHWRRGHLWRGVVAKAFQLLAKIGIFRWLAGYPYVLAPTNILMIGRLREE
jgi:hypothetical protein